MKLVASLTSPFARKIRIALIEKKLDFELHESIPWDADTDVGNYNPLGKVPALVDKGQVWTDSSVIVDYLETKDSATRLIPDNKLQAVQVKQIEALADGVCEAAIIIFLEKKRAEDKQEQDWIDRQQQKINAGLASLEAKLDNKPYFCHNAFSVADIAVVSFLDWFEFRFPEQKWKLSYPALAEYVEKISKRPAFVQTFPS